jgi:hypothetical protein
MGEVIPFVRKEIIQPEPENLIDKAVRLRLAYEQIQAEFKKGNSGVTAEEVDAVDEQLQDAFEQLDWAGKRRAADQIRQLMNSQTT